MMSEFDPYGDSYADKVNESISFSGLKADFFARVKADYLVDLARRELGDPAKLNVLDIGCGIGLSHRQLAAAFGQLTGIDPSATCIERARAAHPEANYLVNNGLTLPVEDGTFDVAVTVCVMHHVPPGQWPAFIGEMARTVRPGGLVAVFEHNPRNPLTRRVVSNCEFDKDAVLLPASRTVQLLRSAGMSSADRFYLLTIPAAGRFLRATDQLLSSIGLGAQYAAWGRK